MAGRFAGALRRSLSLDALISGAVFTALTALISAILRGRNVLPLGDAVLAGCGAGLLGLAAFLQLVVKPERQRSHTDQVGLLVKARDALRRMADRGEQIADDASYARAAYERQWLAHVRDLLSDIGGDAVAERFQAEAVTAEGDIVAQADWLRAYAIEIHANDLSNEYQ